MQDWFEFYGLDRDPFAEGGMYGLFYPGGARQETVEQLLHLARFSDSILLVCGVAGAGKTALRRHFAAQAASDTRCSIVETALLDSPERLLGRILDGFGIAAEPSLALDEGVRRLAQFVDERRAKGLHTWVLIDDAQHLHDDALALLPRLLEHASAHLRLVLFAEPQWQEILESALPHDARIHALELLPFDRGESYAYIHYRLKTAGLEAEPPFNAGEFEEIHRQSGGIPGRINALSRKVLTDAVVEVEQPLSTLPVWHFGVVAVTLLALVLLYVWGSFEEDSGERPVPRPGNVALAPRDPPGAIVIEPEPQHEGIVLREDPLPPASPGEAVEPEPLPVEEESSRPIGPGAEPEPGPGVDTPAARVPAPTVTEEAAVATTVPPPAREEFVYRDGVRAGGQPSADERWLLGLDEGHFVLQIMGSDDQAKVQAFAQRQALPLRQFRKLHNGADWYVLVHGDYPDRASAERALRELPEGLQRSGPWVRRAGAVQEEIRRALDTP